MDVLARVFEAALFGWLGGSTFLAICYLVTKFAFENGTKKQQSHVQTGILVFFFVMFYVLRS